MAKAAKDRMDSLRSRLEMTDEGVVMLDGLRTIILPATVLTAVQGEAERILGRGMGPILYAAGEGAGSAIAARWLARKSGAAPTGAALEAVRADVEARGFGKVEITAIDLAAGTATVRLYRSPYADHATVSGQTACAFPAGFIAGLISGLVDRPVAGTERVCRASRGPYCEFVAEPAPETVVRKRAA